MGSSRNRNAGNGWERETARILNGKSLGDKIIPKDGVGKSIPLSKLPEEYFDLFPKVGTTRELSRSLDSKKIDITTTNPNSIKDFPYLIQNKSIAGSVSYPKLLRLMKEKTIDYEGILVVFHEETEKKIQKNKTAKFFKRDNFAILFLDDFLDMMFELQTLKQTLNKYENGQTFSY